MKVITVTLTKEESDKIFNFVGDESQEKKFKVENLHHYIVFEKRFFKKNVNFRVCLSFNYKGFEPIIKELYHEEINECGELSNNFYGNYHRLALEDLIRKYYLESFK